MITGVGEEERGMSGLCDMVSVNKINNRLVHINVHDRYTVHSTLCSISLHLHFSKMNKL